MTDTITKLKELLAAAERAEWAVRQGDVREGDSRVAIEMERCT